MKFSNSSNTDRGGIYLVGVKINRSGFIFREQPISDCGIDAQIEIVQSEQATGELISLQIKTGESYFKEETSDGFIFRGNLNHLKYWLNHSLPVIIVLCNTTTEDCYWQAITPHTITRTEKAWKVLVPKNQKINPGMLNNLKRMVSKIPIHKGYTIVSSKDVSHGLAKRYSSNVVLSKEHTQLEIINLVKKITKETANTEYHRDEIARRHWRNQSAHVVWLYIYPTLEDEKYNNWLCTTEWISDQLSPEYRPNAISGDEISPDLKIKWNYDYLTRSRLNTENIIDKETHINSIIHVAEETNITILQAEHYYQEYEKSIYSFRKLKEKMEPLATHMNELYKRGESTKLPPYECKELTDKFQNVLTHADNIFLPFINIGKPMTETQTIYNIKSQLRYYKHAITEFEFELKKAR
jgi:hypothetical protein